VAYAVGANWHRIQRVFRSYAIAAWAVLGALAVALIVRWLLRRRAARRGETR
jgi:membrane protein DedA with SNARE-associated domain